MKRRGGKWVDGLAEWTDGEVAYLSVAFTWKLPEAYGRAQWFRALGYRVIAGGPALFLPRMRAQMEGVAEVGGDYPDAVARHNPDATIASRGCPVGCSFCIVPAMEGREFTLLPDFEPRPILCDNNLSALPVEFQNHIIARYQATGVPLMDANSGFEPATFDEDCFARWRAINKGPWRFAFDEQRERAAVERVMAMLGKVTRRKKRVYVLIGNEPFASCLDRINQVIGWGGEPHVQPYYSLTALRRVPRVHYDWTEQTLRDCARWANHWPWHKEPWERYSRSAHTARDRERYDPRQGLLL